MAGSGDFYRKSYERMLREFTRLEDHDLRLVKLFKLTVSRTLIAVEKAYPSLVPLCNRIRSHVSRQADADFPLDRLQIDIEQLSQRLRELESGRDNAAPADEKPDNSRAEYQRSRRTPSTRASRPKSAAASSGASITCSGAASAN